MLDEELALLNSGWRSEYFGLEHKHAIDQLTAADIHFAWDSAPSGMLRFVARNKDGKPLACAVAWPGASKTMLVDRVVRDLEFLATQARTTPHPTSHSGPARAVPTREASQPTVWQKVTRQTLGDW